MSKKVKTLVLWVLLVVLFVAIYEVLQSSPRTASLPPLQSTTRFYQDVEDEAVAAVQPHDSYLVVVPRSQPPYRTNLTFDEGTQDLLRKHNVPLQLTQADRGEDGAGSNSSTSSEQWLAILLVALAFLALLVIVLRRAAARGGANIFGLRKTTARLLSEKPVTRFTDVGGAQHAKEQLADIVDFLKNPGPWHKSGARLPRGVLLEGPPGCGKTLLARALAGEASASFFEVSATEFVELFVGVGAARVRDLFEEAAKKEPAIIFIDEIDAVGRRRGAGAVGLAHQEREQTLNQLLVSLDGFGKKSRVVVMAATNRADVLDPALLRPGRFDIRIAFAPLSTSERREILGIHTRGKPMAGDAQLDTIALQTVDFSGADLEHVCNAAALLAARRSRSAGQAAPLLETRDFLSALGERTGRATRFDKLDALVIESSSQLSQPTGRVVVRLTLDDGTTLEGEVVWVDAAFAKIRPAGGQPLLVSKAQIRKLEPLAGTDVHDGAVAQDRWAGNVLDAL
jgi:cell division protease FtsH